MTPIFRILLATLILAPMAWSQFLFAPVRYQEKTNWDWSAISQIVLDVYGKYISQTAIAAYATPDESNAGNFINGSSTTPNRKGINLILSNFKSLTSTYYARALTASEVTSNLTAGRLIVAGKGSGACIIFGSSGGMIYSISPWPGQGILVQSYASFLDATGYAWTQSLVITSARGTRPTRYITESEVDRTYALYAVDRLTLNDGVNVFSNATTTTSYGKVGSGWALNLANLGTNGVDLGASSKVGSVYTSGPLYMRSNANVTGNVYMLDKTKISQQAGASITGTLTQQAIPYKEFGFGTNEFSGVTKTTVNVEPDQARRTLTPGKYWNYNIKARSPIRFIAGDYSFNDLLCDACTIEIDASAGPVRIFVSGSLLWTGILNYVAGGPSRFMLGYLGSNVTYIDGSLNGTILAPNAHLVIGQAGVKDYTGMYQARNLTVHQYTKIHFSPFAFE